MVGTDIAAGLYNLEVESGIGLITDDLTKWIFIRNDRNYGSI